MSFVDVNRVIREYVNLEDLVARYVSLEKSGSYFKGLCPFHKEKTPSFHVMPDEQFFYCFGCGISGNAITFIMHIESLTFQDAVKKLASEYHIDSLLNENNTQSYEQIEEKNLILETNRAVAMFYHKNLLKTEFALDYLKKRNISKKMIKTFGIGFAGNNEKEFLDHLASKGFGLNELNKSGLIRIDDNNKARQFFFNRIMFPIIDRKKVIGFGGRILTDKKPKYINSSDSLVFNKRTKLFAYNLIREGIKKFKSIIVTEGYFDVVSLFQAGFTNAVAALGTAVTEEHLKLLNKHSLPIIFLMDGDEAGRKSAKKIMKLKMPENIDLRLALIEEQNEDPDSILSKENGKEKLSEILKKAVPLFQHFLDELIEKFNSTQNIEDKIDLEKQILDILKNIPQKKKKFYSKYVFTKSNEEIKTFFKQKSYPKKVIEKKKQTPQSEASEIAKEMIFIALQNKEFIPALEILEKTALTINFAQQTSAIIQSFYDDEELNEKILDEKEFVFFQEKYENLSKELKDQNFNLLLKRLKLLENEEQLKQFPKKTDENHLKMYKKLLESNDKLKKEIKALYSIG